MKPLRKTNRVTGKTHWSGWTKEDGDLLACQFISAFLWVLVVLAVNLLLVPHSENTPQAEARLMEPEPALRPPDLARPEPLPLPRPQIQLASVTYEEVFDEDHKPNYYFLYRDQIRFIEVSPKKKVMMAKGQEPVSSPPKPEEPRPEPKPLHLEWMDMALMEEEEQEPPEPEEEPNKKLPKQVKVAMVKDLAMDLHIQKDVSPELIPESRPEVPQAAVPQTRLSVKDMDLNLQIDKEQPQPVLAEPPRQVPQASLAKVRVAATSMDMAMMEEPAPRKIVREIVHVPEPRAPAVVASPRAAYVSLPMEITSPDGPKKGSARPSKTAVKKDTREPVTLARGTKVTMSDIPMSLETAARPQQGPRGSQPAKEKSKGAGLVAVNNKGTAGLGMPLGILEGNGTKQEKPLVSKAAAPSPVPAKMILRSAQGSLPLGTPLAFKLGEVGDETSSGNKYIQMSAQIKRLLEQKHMPALPVTLALHNSAEKGRSNHDLVKVSYSRTQIVLQYANGKQQVVTLVSGEPYPRFELRRTGSGSGPVPVGTKLEEILSCLTTFKNILKD